MTQLLSNTHQVSISDTFSSGKSSSGQILGLWDLLTQIPPLETVRFRRMRLNAKTGCFRFILAWSVDHTDLFHIKFDVVHSVRYPTF